jgi:hypothetical protein
VTQLPTLMLVCKRWRAVASEPAMWRFVHGARFSAEAYTRGMPLSFTPLLCLTRCRTRDQWHASRVVAFLPVDTANSVQSLKVRCWLSCCELLPLH